MPRCEVVFYRDEDGAVPVLSWLQEVARRDVRVASKVRARLALLAELGPDLRRPLSDSIGDGLYELRIRFGSVNYRVLYFFRGALAVVLVHGLMKEDRIPERDRLVALDRKLRFERKPAVHTYPLEDEDG